MVRGYLFLQTLVVRSLPIWLLTRLDGFLLIIGSMVGFLVLHHSTSGQHMRALSYPRTCDTFALRVELATLAALVDLVATEPSLHWGLVLIRFNYRDRSASLSY
eukprot:3881214-Prymnesium_polylepis.1